MKITSQQIAALAGVSRGTVDRALNHRGGVRPAVQKRVEEIARQYGYRPNRAGKALVTRAPLPVEILLNAQGNPFFDEVQRGLAAALDDYSDFPVQAHTTLARGYHLESQIAQLDAYLEAPPAGLILTPLNHPAVAQRLDALIRAGCPVVALNSDVEGCGRLAYVGCDYRRSGQTAAQMTGLITGGTARLLLVTGSLKVMGHNQRVYGFSRVARRDFPHLEIVDVVENNDDDARSFEEVTGALQANPAIDAVFFCAGGVAGGVDAAKRHGVKTIVVCDATPAVRTLLQSGQVQAAIGQQPYRQGYDGMKTLLAYLLFGQKPASEHLYMENEIFVKYNV